MVDVYVFLASVMYIAHYENMYFYLLRLNALICNQIIADFETNILWSVSTYFKLFLWYKFKFNYIFRHMK